MGNITETGHFEELQEESDKDKCNLCNNDSPYDKSEPVDDRTAYIEGSGQMCFDCYEKVYGSISEGRRGQGYDYGEFKDED